MSYSTFFAKVTKYWHSPTQSYKKLREPALFLFFRYLFIAGLRTVRPCLDRGTIEALSIFSKKSDENACRFRKNAYLCNRNRERKQLYKHSGALVQLVRIHACHAWGHGFESRTHRLKPWFSTKSRLFYLCFSRIRSHSSVCLLCISRIRFLLKKNLPQTTCPQALPAYGSTCGLFCPCRL